MRPDAVPSRLRGALGPLRRRVTLTLVVLLGLFLANAAIVVAAAHARDHSREIVETKLNPAQIDVERLLTALVNQESGELGYQLTLNDSFLRTFRLGVLQERRTVESLEHRLAGHRGALGSLESVEAAAANWRSHTTAERAERRRAGETSARLTTDALQGTALFDTIRGDVATLTGQVATLQSQAQRQQGEDDGWLLRSVVIVLVTALIVALVGLVVLRRSLTRPLEDLVASIEGVKEGDLASPVEGRGPREFVQVGSAVEAMRERLLLDASQTLNRSLVMATEDQRRRLAADIHDDPTQALTAVTLRLQRLRRRLVGDDADMLADAERAAAAALARLRNLMFELHSPILDSEGLVAALCAYVEDTFDPEQTRCTVDGRGVNGGDGGGDGRVDGGADGTVGDLPPSVQALAYRLTRSALLNVAKHADASEVSVHLVRRDGSLSVRVRDDGRGFDPSSVAVPEPGHLGLTASADFVRAAGGSYSVASAPGLGTTVEFWLPAA